MKRFTRFIELDNHRACVEQTGQGPPLVFLPSILIRAKTYRRLTDLLRRRFTVFAVEMPGCGAASKLDEPWSFEKYADFLLALLDTLAPSRVTLLAHSNSAPVALLAAAAHAHRFEHLILADPTGFATAPIWRLAAGRFIDGLLEAPFSLTALRDVLFNALHHTENVLNQIRLAGDADLTDVACRVQVPTLIAWGRLDFTYPVSAAARAHRLLPRSSLYISKAGSHDWLVQRPAEFASAVDRFVSDP